MKTKIMIVDDHQIVIDGLLALLKDEPEMDIVGVALCAEDCLNMLESKSIDPDLILMDIEMTGMDGIEATQLLTKKFPNIKVLMLTMWKNPAQIRKALKAGAKGYIHKDAGKEELIDGILDVANGNGRFYSKEIVNVMMDDIGGITHSTQYRAPKYSLHLTSREKEILILISTGHTSKESASELFISEETVKAHRKNMLEKAKSVGIKSMNELIRFAVETHLI